jgi:acetyltransferase-like isoleucine patch superfamily enzyme
VPEVSAGIGLRTDRTAILGYPPARIEGTDLVLGRDAHIRGGTTIYLGSRIGDRFQTGHNVVVREECAIGDDVSVWSNTVVDYGCRIGNGVKIHSNCYIAQYTDIEDDAFLAPGVTIANDLYPGQDASARVMSGPSIGRGAQIGVNVTVLPFVRIGAGCLIGAGAVVVFDIPDGSVAFGNPAVVRGQVDDLTSIEKRVEAVSNSASRYRRMCAAPLSAAPMNGAPMAPMGAAPVVPLNGRRDERDR